MGKHKFKVMSFFGIKRMKSKTKDIRGDLACNVGSNSFLGVHVHHNVGS